MTPSLGAPISMMSFAQVCMNAGRIPFSTAHSILKEERNSDILTTAYACIVLIFEFLNTITFLLDLTVRLWTELNDYDLD